MINLPVAITQLYVSYSMQNGFSVFSRSNKSKKKWGLKMRKSLNATKQRVLNHQMQ